MMRRHLPTTVSAVAASAAAAGSNRVHRWPMTPRITRWLRTKGTAERSAGFEADRVAHGIDVTERGDGHLLMTPSEGHQDDGGRDLVVGPDEGWVLWIHGGGFCWGSARDGTGLRLAAGLSRAVISVEYSLAPEAPFPAALEDCLAAYADGVAERGPKVLLGGVSAGANLALAVLQRIRALRAAGDEMPLPLGVVALTPFGDLAGEGDSYRFNEGRDAWIRWRGQQERFARAYAGEADRRAPLLSPVHADWSGEELPPIFLSTGTRDLFLSDAVRIHESWRAVGGDADIVVAEGMWHSYLSDGGLPESAALLARLLDWCEDILAEQRA